MTVYIIRCGSGFYVGKKAGRPFISQAAAAANTFMTTGEAQEVIDWLNDLGIPAEIETVRVAAV